jgi:Antibiotic biosynthesis monooxygenase
MIVEYIRYAIPSERAEDFEAAYAHAAAALKASEHCLGSEPSRCVEARRTTSSGSGGDSVEGHINGFRSSPEFRQFMADVGSFYDQTEETRHYTRTNIVRGPRRLRTSPRRPRLPSRREAAPARFSDVAILSVTNPLLRPNRSG